MFKSRHHNAEPRFIAATMLTALLVTSLVTGCAGYRLGPTNPELTAGKRIQVNLFENQTLEPNLPEALNHALRKQLQQDGSYRLATRSDGDVVIRGVILNYDRAPLAFQPTDVVTVTDFEVRLLVKITALERTTGRLLIEREVAGRTSVRVGADLPSAERQALPLLAADWARNATSLLTEGSW
jgi:hypothetical protein